jgi:hypothetical protein
VRDDVQVEAVAGGVYPAVRDAACRPRRLQQLVRRGGGRVQKGPISGTETLEVFVCGARGRAIAQAVSRWLPTAAARVRTRV